MATTCDPRAGTWNGGPCGPAPCTGECRAHEYSGEFNYDELREGYGDTDPWAPYATDDSYYAKVKP